jgi:hypothetical protein
MQRLKALLGEMMIEDECLFDMQAIHNGEQPDA